MAEVPEILGITEKQRARHEADQLRLLINGTTEYAIFMLDPEGHVVTWNAGAERLTGYKDEEIIGQHFSRFYPPDAIEREWPEHELEVALSRCTTAPSRPTAKA
jgi:PAS domain S-box-containing protein